MKLKQLFMSAFLMIGLTGLAQLDGRLLAADAKSSSKTPALQPADFTASDLEGLQKRLQSSEFLRVDFVQKKTSRTRPNRPVIVKGHAMFQRPDRFRWVLGEPINEETVFNGRDLFKYLPRENTAARYSARGQQAREVRKVVDFVLNVGSLLKSYKLDSGKRNGNLVHLSFVPVEAAADEIVNLEMTVDEAAGFVSRVFFSLRNKASLEVNFSNPDRRRLTPLTFAIPATVKVNDVL